MRKRPKSTNRRILKTRVRSAKGRKASSTRWLQRQLNDPYVIAARKDGYRSRSAYKLIELDDRFRLLAPGRSVVDLGCAPGGWSQVAAQRVNAGGFGPGQAGCVVGVDLSKVEPIDGVKLLSLDIYCEEAEFRIQEALGGKADVVLSDMAPAASGNRHVDGLRIVALCEAAFAFAVRSLRPGGAFVAKVLESGADSALQAELKRKFAYVRNAKPHASRSDSSEKYVVAVGLK